jgi:hypothetical protein
VTPCQNKSCSPTRKSRTEIAVDDITHCCKDCGTNTSAINEYYMVHDELWRASGLSKDCGMLCIACLEARIGRTLSARDFTECPINRGFFRRSKRFLDRLRSEVSRPVTAGAPSEPAT